MDYQEAHDLTTLQPGDEVAEFQVRFGFLTCTFGTVKRVTKTRVVVEFPGHKTEYPYMIDSGFLVGSGYDRISGRPQLVKAEYAREKLEEEQQREKERNYRGWFAVKPWIYAVWML